MKNVTVTVEKNEERILPFFFADGENCELSVEVRLVGEGAKVDIVGIFVGSSDNMMLFNTSVVHLAPRTVSKTTLRGVLRDTSSFSNDGIISIQKGAKGADGFFSSKLLLFDNAKGKSIPSLEIEENDLKAGHASTIGRPDPYQLFYLKSRGLSDEEARRLIVTGFFIPSIELFPVEERKSVKKRLSL